MQPHTPNSRSTWASHDDNGGFFLAVILACACVFAYLLWTYEHSAISAAVMQWQRLQIGFIRNFTNRYDLADRQMAQAYPSVVTLHDLYSIIHKIGAFFRLPAVIVMLLLGVVCMVRAAPSRFKRSFDLESLARETSISYPVTRAFVRRKLRLVLPAGTPRPADYALTRDEWVACYASVNQPAKNAARNRPFDESAARQALALQLGPLWRGMETATPQVRVMVAVFALHLAGRRSEVTALLGQLSAGLRLGGHQSAAGPDKPLPVPQVALAHVGKLMQDFPLFSPALAIMDRHGFAHTALMSLLKEARLKNGVLAPAQFAWLKLVDRGLWYALHSLGYETEGYGRYVHPNPQVEAVGARDHWAVERLMGEPVGKPDIERALNAVRRGLPFVSDQDDASDERDAVLL